MEFTLKKNIAFLLLFLIFVASCASTPTGEWKYLPVDGFFKSDITQSELSLLQRQSALQCENDLIKLKSQSTNQKKQSTSNTNSPLDAFRQGAAMSQQMDAAQRMKRFYPNCMELNGFKRTWIPNS